MDYIDQCCVRNDVLCGEDDVQKGAIFSVDGRYRYALWRIWEPLFATGNTIAWIGLNPSTATEAVDDPTIRRCMNFSRKWGFAGMHMLNLFAFRSTDPKKLRHEVDPIGPENDAIIREVTLKCPKVVCCWGRHGALRDRDAAIEKMLEHHLGLSCLGFNKDKTPKHPLYLSVDTRVQGF